MTKTEITRAQDETKIKWIDARKKLPKKTLDGKLYLVVRHFKNEYRIYIPIDDGKLNVHHIVPVSEGGGDEPTNLITLCVGCHRKRHGRRNHEENVI